MEYFFSRNLGYNFHYFSMNFTILKYNLHNFRCNLHYFLLTTAQNCLADKFRSKTELKVSWASCNIYKLKHSGLWGWKSWRIKKCFQKQTFKYFLDQLSCVFIYDCFQRFEWRNSPNPPFENHSTFLFTSQSLYLHVPTVFTVLFSEVLKFCILARKGVDCKMNGLKLNFY